MLSARCCCVTAVELASLLPGLGPLLPGLALPGLAPESQPGLASLLPGLAPLLPGLAPENQPGRAASAISRGLQPKDAPS